MQQLNQSAPDTQSVHIVTMEVACQQLQVCRTYQETGGWTHRISQQDNVCEHTTQYIVQWNVFCSPNSSTVVSASLGISLAFIPAKYFEPPPNDVTCVLLSHILQDVRVCPHRGFVPSGRVSCGEGRQLNGGCRFKKHLEYTIVQFSRLLPIVGYNNYGPLQLRKPNPPSNTHTHTLYFSNLTGTIHTSVVTCVHGNDVKFNHHLSGKLETQQACNSQAIPTV